MKRLLLTAAILLGSVSLTAAAQLEFKIYSLDVEPGKVLRQDLSCAKEQLISGGYGIEDVKGGPMTALFVAANTFADKGTWRVEFVNTHDATLTVDFRITIFCD